MTTIEFDDDADSMGVVGLLFVPVKKFVVALTDDDDKVETPGRVTVFLLRVAVFVVV
jgi:hypothetical protein